VRHLHLLALLLVALPARGASGWLPERMEVSAEVQGTLSLLPASAYPRAELDARFDLLREKGDAFCRAWTLRQKVPGALDFLVEGVRARIQSIPSGGRTSMVLGCRNFYEMNDIRPDRAFALVRALESPAGAPPPRFDCYSVGLMQPWLMHRALGCRRLGMVDLDWRILEVHHRLAGLLAGGRLSSPGAVRTELGALDLRWLALRNLDAEGHVTGPAPVLCRSGQDGFCQSALAELQAGAPPERVDLLLTGLEDLSLGPNDAGVRRVVFLSNAIEYMAEGRTLGMIQRLADGLPAEPGASALVIHHAGGSAAFGIYRVERGTGRRFVLRHVCKDVYPSTRTGSTEPTYTTVLDEASVASAAPPPTCGELLARFKLGAPLPLPARPTLPRRTTSRVPLHGQSPCAHAPP
jgi:hypothetical protein